MWGFDYLRSHKVMSEMRRKRSFTLTEVRLSKKQVRDAILTFYFEVNIKRE